MNDRGPSTPTPIDSFRRVVEVLRRAAAAGDVDAQWFLAAAEAYFDGARAGDRLDRLLGLTPAPGATPWWEAEAREKRDDAIRALRRQHFADMSIPAAARTIATAASRYQASAGRHDPPPRDPQKILLTEALQTGQPFPGARQIETILRNDL